MADLEDKLPKEMIDYLDKLVATGHYRDRWDVLRKILGAVMEAVEVAKEEVGIKRKHKDTGGKVVIQMKRNL